MSYRTVHQRHGGGLSVTAVRHLSDDNAGDRAKAVPMEPHLRLSGQLTSPCAGTDSGSEDGVTKWPRPPSEIAVCQQSFESFGPRVARTEWAMG
jgi:hypothetical protein